MKYFILLILTVLIFCSQDTSLDPYVFLPSSEELSEQFDFKFVSKDSIRIFSKESAIFHEPYFSSILIGYKADDLSFIITDSITADYLKISQSYRLDFSRLFKITQRVDPYINDHIEVQLKLVINKRDFRFISFDVYPHKYPYETAKILLKKSTINNQEVLYRRFVELYVTGEYIYYMDSPNGRRIYKYDRKTKKAQLILWTVGFFFTLHQDYLYGEFLDRRIVKYNLSTETYDLEIAEELLENNVIRGIDIYQDRLYILHNINYPEISHEYFLSSFNLDGEFIESIPFNISPNCWGFCIYKDIVYVIDTYDPQLHRYRLSEHRFLTSLVSPSDDLEAIHISANTLYFTKYLGYLICYMPLTDLIEKNNQ